MPYDIASILQGTDEKSFDQILKQFIRNIKKLSGKYKFQKRIWNTYWDRFFFVLWSVLKLNQQKEGIASYSKFVNLMVNYYKDNPL
jgi:hypothetical protein